MNLNKDVASWISDKVKESLFDKQEFNDNPARLRLFTEFWMEISDFVNNQDKDSVVIELDQDNKVLETTKIVETNAGPIETKVSNGRPIETKVSNAEQVKVKIPASVEKTSTPANVEKTQLFKGGRGSNALTDEQKQVIREIYRKVESGVSFSVLAEEYGISSVTIGHMVWGKSKLYTEIAKEFNPYRWWSNISNQQRSSSKWKPDPEVLKQKGLLDSKETETKVEIPASTAMESKLTEKYGIASDQWVLDMMKKRYVHLATISDLIKEYEIDAQKYKDISFGRDFPHLQADIKALKDASLLRCLPIPVNANIEKDPDSNNKSKKHLQNHQIENLLQHLVWKPTISNAVLAEAFNVSENFIYCMRNRKFGDRHARTRGMLMDKFEEKFVANEPMPMDVQMGFVDANATPEPKVDSESVETSTPESVETSTPEKEEPKVQKKPSMLDVVYGNKSLLSDTTELPEPKNDRDYLIMSLHADSEQRFRDACIINPAQFDNRQHKSKLTATVLVRLITQELIPHFEADPTNASFQIQRGGDFKFVSADEAVENAGKALHTLFHVESGARHSTEGHASSSCGEWLFKKLAKPIGWTEGRCHAKWQNWSKPVFQHGNAQVGSEAISWLINNFNNWFKSGQKWSDRPGIENGRRWIGAWYQVD